MLRLAMQTPAQKAHQENPMNSLHYIGFDVHKKAISFCVKTAAGEIVEEGSVLAQRAVLQQWAATRPQPWRGALEATLFSSWIYDTLKPYPSHGNP
jgi:transposase